MKIIFFIFCKIVFSIKGHVVVNGIIIEIKNIPKTVFEWNNATFVTDNSNGNAQIIQTDTIAEGTKGTLGDGVNKLISSCVGISKKKNKKNGKFYKNSRKNQKIAKFCTNFKNSKNFTKKC